MSAEPTIEPQWPVVPSPMEVAERLLAIKQQVEDIIAEAVNHLVIDSDDSAKAALDYVDIIQRGAKTIEERRLKYVEKPNEFVKGVNGIVKGYAMQLDGAKRSVNQVILAYRNKKQAEEVARQKEVRDRQEAEALERAERMAKSGNTAGADALLEIAATAPKAVPTTKLRSNEGAGFVTSTYWIGQLVDRRAFIQAVLDGKVAFPLDSISVSQSELNALARNSKVDGQIIHGMKVVKDERGTVRS